MNEEKEFYLGYLRNPKQTLKDGFDEIKEYEVILIHDYNDYREVVTREKIYLTEKNQVFDGHKVYKSQAGFIGRLGRRLTTKEAHEMMTDIRNNRMDEYVSNIHTLLYDTLEMYLEGEKSYQETVEEFKQSFRKK